MVFVQSENWQEQIQVFWNGSLGKWDLSFIHLRMAGMIRQFQQKGYQAPIKSIGNSTTTPRDLENDQDVQIILMALVRKCRSQTAETWF